LPRGRRFKSCPRYQSGPDSSVIPGLKAVRDLIRCPQSVHLLGLNPSCAPDRRNRHRLVLTGAASCGFVGAPVWHGDEHSVERPGAADRRRGARRSAPSRGRTRVRVRCTAIRAGTTARDGAGSGRRRPSAGRSPSIRPPRSPEKPVAAGPGGTRREVVRGRGRWLKERGAAASSAAGVTTRRWVSMSWCGRVAPRTERQIGITAEPVARGLMPPAASRRRRTRTVVLSRSRQAALPSVRRPRKRGGAMAAGRRGMN
jgi:hypothetical protein